MNLREMLDLPPDERRRYLHALPLTRTYVFGCMEGWDIRHIRRVLTRNGGIFREVYRYPGVYWDVTFRDYAGMRRAGEELVRWMNEAIKDPEFRITTDELARMGGVVPVFSFEKDIWIDSRQPRRISRHAHPIRG